MIERRSAAGRRHSRFGIRWFAGIGCLLATACFAGWAGAGNLDGLAAAPRSIADLHWLAGDLVDYAPVGMPDFSQCRAAWGQAGAPGLPGQWTYAGPVALANLLWWLDSLAEPAPRPPDTASDHHGLVTAYPAFGPARDDHAAANLEPLVEDLAFRADTDGRRSARSARGTRVEDLAAGLGAYLAARRLDAHYSLEEHSAPDAAWLDEMARQPAGVLLVLGVWEEQAGAWRRVGGHFASLAGVDAAGYLALSDPLADMGGERELGRVQPPEAGLHSCRNAPRAHDDAGVLSHDVYRLERNPPLPGDPMVLAEYFGPDSYGEAAAFAGQNPSSALAAHAADWQRGRVVMALDAALALIPAPAILPASPSPQASPSASSTATRTPSPSATAPPSTATASVRPTSTGTVSAPPSATREASATPSERPDPARLWLPRLVSGLR